MNQKINSKTASKLIGKMLVGAYLDRIVAHSIQVSLGFLTNAIAAAQTNEVVVTFTCSAIIKPSDQTSTPDESREFFAERGLFFAQAYELIGETVSVVEVQADGALRLTIGTKSVDLWLLAEDLAADDWIWKVAIEEDGEADAIYCCPVSTEIVFTSSGSRD